MDKRELICIGCPVGCQLTAQGEGDSLTITGNLCKIGKDYGIKECTDPRRIITTSLKIKNEDGTVSMVSVKTNSDVPKNRIFDCLEEIKRYVPQGEIKIGQVVIENILGLGADIVATR